MTATNTWFGSFRSMATWPICWPSRQFFEVRPGLAGIGGLVDAIAGGEIGALQALTASHVDGVRIALRNGNRAARLTIPHTVPRCVSVSRLPNTAVHYPR